MSVEYEFNQSPIDAYVLKQEIDAAGTIGPKCMSVNTTEAEPLDKVCICFDSALTTAEEHELDLVLIAHLGYDLNVLKAERRLEVSEHTQYLVASGFTFDSVVFDLAHMARTTWIGMYTLKHLLTWPKDIGTIDGETYSLDESDIEGFMGTALGTYDYILSGERTLKHAINAATDKDELDAVVDDR